MANELYFIYKCSEQILNRNFETLKGKQSKGKIIDGGKNPRMN